MLSFLRRLRLSQIFRSALATFTVVSNVYIYFKALLFFAPANVLQCLKVLAVKTSIKAILQCCKEALLLLSSDAYHWIWSKNVFVFCNVNCFVCAVPSKPAIESILFLFLHKCLKIFNNVSLLLPSSTIKNTLYSIKEGGECRHLNLLSTS